jgi:hypothetical protein
MAVAVERGARATLWQAAALGLMLRVEERFGVVPPPTVDETPNAFWCAPPSLSVS